MGLDVLSAEPPPADHPLTRADTPWSRRVVITPHIGWGTTIPILVGAKFTVIPNVYVAGEIGFFNTHTSIDTPVGTFSGSDTNFGLTLGGGYRLNQLDLRLQLEFLDLGHAGDSMALVASVGYDFWRK